MPAPTSSKLVAQAAPCSALIQFCFHFDILFVSETLNMVERRHHRAVGGFFDAPQGRMNDTSFEGGTKSGAMLRCPWATTEPAIAYHDEERGVPVHDDRVLFEFLMLEGAQAGLSWMTILKKRENYRKAFDGFRAEKVAHYGAHDVKRLLRDEGIVRNRLKIAARSRTRRRFSLCAKNSGRSTLTYGASSSANRSRIAGESWPMCPRAPQNPMR